MVDGYCVCLVEGDVQFLNKELGPLVREAKKRGVNMTIISIPEDTYDFLYNSMIEKAVSEGREKLKF